MKNTCQKGNVTEALVLARFVQKDYKVFIPFGEGHKCDLVFEDNLGNLKKVQIKKSRATKRGFMFNLYSNGGGYNKIRYTKKDIDYFATEFEGNCYLLPVEASNGQTTITLHKDSTFLF